jgi:hypothetical protein
MSNAIGLYVIDLNDELHYFSAEPGIEQNGFKTLITPVLLYPDNSSITAIKVNFQQIF